MLSRNAQAIPTPEAHWVDRWNQTAAPYPTDRCLHHGFEQSAKFYPHATAVDDGTDRLTYAELNRRAGRIADRLRRHGVGPGAMVGVHLERTVQLPAVLLAVLKVGGTYVPFDRSWPATRIRQVIDTLSLKYVVVSMVYADSVDEATKSAASSVQVWELPPEEQGGESPHDSNRDSLGVADAVHDLDNGAPVATDSASDPDALAYVIFTSGSTGHPKGVMVRHRPVSNLIDWVNRTFDVGPSDRLLFVTSLCFDLSVYDLFGILTAGGCVRIATEQELDDPRQLRHVLETEHITFWDSAPAFLHQLLTRAPGNNALTALRVKSIPGNERDQTDLESLRLVFLSGDWVPLSSPDQIRDRFPCAKVVALGGATEATVWSNWYEVQDVDPAWSSIPYGRPIQNARYYILDTDGHPCPAGKPGELYIGGECLAEGYANDIERTQSQFVADPFFGLPGGRMYRTGDLAQWQSDGLIELLGRTDRQVKINGYRVELAEVEAALRSMDGVDEAVVCLVKNPKGSTNLVAHLAAAEEIDPTSVRRGLRHRLPSYMVPAQIRQHDALPLTINGKVDRDALLAWSSPSGSKKLSGASDGVDGIATRNNATRPPRGIDEQELGDIFRRVLGESCGAISRNDRFADLGGDSLGVLDVMLQAEHLGFSFSSTQLRSLTLTQLATHRYPPEHTTPSVEAESCESSEVQEFIPTPSQQWVFDREFVRPERYAFGAWYTVDEPLDPERLNRAWAALHQRHDALRLSFAQRPTGFVQSLSPRPCPRPIEHVALPGSNCSPQRETLDQIALNAIETVKLDQPGLAKLLVAASSTDRSWVFLYLPHLLIDGHSVRVLLSDLDLAYRQPNNGHDLFLAQVSPDSWAKWCRFLERGGGALAEAEAQRWLALPWDQTLLFPRDDDGRTPNTYALTRSMEVLTSRELTRSLHHSGEPMNGLLLAALASALGAWAAGDSQHQSEVAVDITGHGREPLPGAPERYKNIGFYSTIHPVLLPTEIALDREGLHELKKRLDDAPGRGNGFGLLRDRHPTPVVRERVAAMPPPQIKFNYHGREHTEPSGAGGLLQPTEIGLPSMLDPEDRRAYLLNLEVSHRGGRLQMQWRYNEAIHHPETIERLAEDYLERLGRLLEGLGP